MMAMATNVGKGFIVVPSKTVDTSSVKRENFSNKVNTTRGIKMIKSMALYKMIVPNSLSTGMSSV